MRLSLTRPLVCIDLETTGTSITEDQIVEKTLTRRVLNHERVVRDEATP